MKATKHMDFDLKCGRLAVQEGACPFGLHAFDTFPLAETYWSLSTTSWLISWLAFNQFTLYIISTHLFDLVVLGVRACWLSRLAEALTQFGLFATTVRTLLPAQFATV